MANNQANETHCTSTEVRLFERVSAIAAVLGVVILYCFYFAAPGSPDVPDYWLRWIQMIKEHGIREAYSLAKSDYPPGSFGIFASLLHLFPHSLSSNFNILKCALVGSSLLSALVYGLWSKDLWKTAFFLLAILLSSNVLAYLDVLYVPPLLLALLALKHRRLYLASLLFSIATMMKWQPLIIAPFFVIEACDIRGFTKRDVQTVLLAIGKLALGSAPVLAVMLVVAEFGAVEFSLTRALSHHPLSSQGLNGNWVAQMILYYQQGAVVPEFYDATVPQFLRVGAKFGFWLVYTSVLFLFVLRRKTFSDFLWFACIGYYSYYCLNIGVHENHLFVALILALTLLCVRHPLGFATVCYLAIASNLNLLIFYGLDGRIAARSAQFIGSSIALSLLNMAFFILCMAVIFKRPLKNFEHASRSPTT